MGSNKLTAIDETEYLSPSQSPETSFLQLSPTKLTITKTYSNKGRFMSIVSGYNLQFLNFNRKKTIKSGRRTSRSCNVILHTNSDDTFIRFSGTITVHNFSENSQLSLVFYSDHTKVYLFVDWANTYREAKKQHNPNVWRENRDNTTPVSGAAATTEQLAATHSPDEESATTAAAAATTAMPNNLFLGAVADFLSKSKKYNYTDQAENYAVKDLLTILKSIKNLENYEELEQKLLTPKNRKEFVRIHLANSEKVIGFATGVIHKWSVKFYKFFRPPPYISTEEERENAEAIFNSFSHYIIAARLQLEDSEPDFATSDFVIHWSARSFTISFAREDLRETFEKFLQKTPDDALQCRKPEKDVRETPASANKKAKYAVLEASTEDESESDEEDWLEDREDETEHAIKDDHDDILNYRN
ncbi:unnamed protein product [Rotaria magnacalcarata]